MTDAVDLLVRGGTVIAMDAARAVRAADVLVRDQTIVKIAARIVPTRPTRVLDAWGCAVMPGFVQAHVHLCQALFRGMGDDLPLLEWLQRRIWPLEAAHDPRSLGASARLGLTEMMRAGTTTILDMGTVHHQDAVFEAMHEAGIRGSSGKAMMDRGAGVPKGLRESTKASLEESERLLERWNGAAAGLLRYAFAPRFVLSCTEQLLRDTAALAEQYDAIVHTHASEHPGEKQAVIAELGKVDVAALADFGIRGPRAVLAHCVQLTAAEMKRVARAETRVVHCPSANLKLASGIAPIHAMRAAGIVIGLGADGAPCNNRMDPFTEMREAALLAKAREHDASVMPALDALALATIEGARVLGLDDTIGSLEVGKRADLAVVDVERTHTLPGGDAVARVVYACTAADVRHVVVDGRIVVKGGVLTTLDEERVRAEARREAKRVLSRAKLA